MSEAEAYRSNDLPKVTVTRRGFLIVGVMAVPTACCGITIGGSDCIENLDNKVEFFPSERWLADQLQAIANIQSDLEGRESSLELRIGVEAGNNCNEQEMVLSGLEVDGELQWIAEGVPKEDGVYNPSIWLDKTNPDVAREVVIEAWERVNADKGRTCLRAASMRVGRIPTRDDIGKLVKAAREAELITTDETNQMLEGLDHRSGLYVQDSSSTPMWMVGGFGDIGGRPIGLWAGWTQDGAYLVLVDYSHQFGGVLKSEVFESIDQIPKEMVAVLQENWDDWRIFGVG